MTHNTPDGTDKRRLWCARCELSVEPVAGDTDPECPACGREFGYKSS